MPRRVDHDAERLRLARASVDLFAAKGFARVSMRAAAEALGVSTGTLYHYFRDKADLFDAVVTTVVESDVAEVGAGLRMLAASARLGALLQATVAPRDRLVRDYRVLIEAVAVLPGAFDPAIARARRQYQIAVMDVLDLDEASAELVLLALSGMILRALCGDRGTDVAALQRSLQQQQGVTR